MTKNELLSLVRPTVRTLEAYHLDRHDVPVKLDQNEHATGPPESVKRELGERLRSVPWHRYPTPGEPELRHALSELVDWPAEGILVGNGSDELLHTLASAVLEPGRTAVAPTPSFFVYPYAARLAGGDVVEVSLTEALEYDVPALEAAVEEKTPHLLFLCSPNNPTGSVLSPSEIASLVEKAPGLVALDEAYWEFTGWNARKLLDRFSNLVLLRTFSKALGMAGLRIGYLLAEPSLVREIHKAQQPYVLNRLSKEAALVALGHYQEARARASAIAEARERLFGRLAAIEGVRVFPSKANFLLFRTRLGAKRTFRGLLERGVLVRDVSRHPLLAETLRMSVGTPEEIESVCRALEEMMEEGA